MNLSAGDRAMLSRINAAINTLRTIYLDMTVTQAVVILTVAYRPGVAQSDIVNLTGLSEASVSRIVAITGSKGDRGAGPFQLLEARVSPRDNRARELHLTPKGGIVMAAILREFTGVTYDRPPKD